MQKTSEVYNKLYHYTSWDGLLGILQTQTLWATHYRFLNDYSEIVLFRDKLIEFILPYVLKEYKKLIELFPNVERVIDQNGGLSRVIQHDTAAVVDATYRATGEEIYIASFCGEHKYRHININGLLSQWRGYGIGGGLALVFETQELEKILQLEAKRFSYDSGHISDLIYSDDEKKFRKELSAKLSDIAEYVKEMFLHMKLNKQEAPDATKAYHSFVQCISRYKHHGFKEENEVRIVALPTVQNEEYLELAKKEGSTLKPEKDRKFHQKKGQLVPYIELFNPTDIVLPIERIIVGPHKEKESRASALRVMLRKTNIEITVSDIPYVN